MERKIDGVLLTSGGLDSTVLAYDLLSQGKCIIPLFLQYGQHCEHKEFETLNELLPEKILKYLKVINVEDIYSHSKSRMIVEANLWEDRITSDDLYLPYRNLLFMAIGSAFAQSLGIHTVYAAFINSNHAKEIDCSSDFFSKLETLLDEYGSVKIEMPYRFLSKREVAEIGLELNVPIGKTYSCQVNSSNPCGACPNCVDRLDALMSFTE